MGNTLLVDNWLLQDIGSCLSDGLSTDAAYELVINRSKDSHSIRDVPMAGVQIEALLGLLVDIVLRDSIIVDSAFTGAWTEKERIFSPLLAKGLMRAHDLYLHEDKLKEPRRIAVEQLCVTSSLREAQKKNEQSWENNREPDNQYLSQVIWGTAGMFSRSHVFMAPYSGHPLRKRVIEQSVLAIPSRDAVTETQMWMNEERLRLFESMTENGKLRIASLVLPPIAAEIIEESKNIDNLIPVAVQMRDKYSRLREWLRAVQEGMESEDSKSIAKYKKTLNVVSNDLNRAVGSANAGSISINIGWVFPSISIPVDIDGIKKKLGIRAILNNQIFSPQGEKSLEKLLRMFDEEKSRLGISVQQYLKVTRSK